MRVQSGKEKSETTETFENEIPDFIVDTLARCLLSKIQAYFDSPEGQAEFERWKQQQKKNT